jgi:hypothetical protein
MDCLSQTCSLFYLELCASAFIFVVKKIRSGHSSVGIMTKLRAR